METNANLDQVYRPSEEVVAREIEGEVIIVPLTAGIGDMEDELFTMNETGKAIWKQMDGKKSLRDISQVLSAIYGAVQAEIEKDAVGFASELLKRKIIVGK